MTVKPPNPILDPFDFPSVVRQEGELEVDHRASPGLTEEQARRFGYEPTLAREGKVFREAVLACAHCPSVFMKKRGTDMIGRCTKCNAYICDACVAASKDPTYVHYTRQQMIDLVTSGWTLSGSMSLPIFTKTVKE